MGWAGVPSLARRCGSAQAFLEQGLYRSPKSMAEGGAKKDAYALFRRTIGRTHPVVYSITERAPAPDSPEWGRVVAVFVMGQTWQFKTWPHKARMSLVPCDGASERS